MKHLFRFSLLVLALLLPAIASAQDFYVNGIYYLINGNEATVTYKGTSYYQYNEYSGDVTIPATVTYGGTTYSVTSIGEGSFSGCSSLTSIDIPNSVTSIGSFAFYHCSNLANIQVASGNPTYDSRNNCNAIIETATNSLIAGCINTVIPNSVTFIGDYAFSGTGLTSITIPNSVISIGYAAFSQCDGLSSVTIPNSVTTIGNSAFSDCDDLSSVTIPNSVTTIGDYAFYFCYSLTRIDIPNSVTYIGDYTFSWCGLTRIDIPNSVTYIGDYAFSGCSNLTSANIPNSATYIGEGVFTNCIGLKNVTFPYNIKTIVQFMFYGCMGLTQIAIPNSVTTIESCAFYGTGLTSVTIPNSVKKIEVLAFSDCYNLLSVTIGNSVNYIGPHAFGCQGYIGDLIFGNYCNLTNIVVADGNSTYDSRNNCNAIIETASNTLVVGGANTIIPKTVTSIGEYAFEGCCPNEIDIPNSVTSIGDYAFYNWGGLTSITIPNSVTYIGDEAFGQNGYHYSSDPYSVYSYILDPSQVTLGNDVFQWRNWLPILHVPYGLSQAYLADGRWCPFDTIVEMDLVTSIELNVTMTSLNVGKTFQLSATVLPSNAIKTVTWTSSNPIIATVDADGLVTAHAIGTATITAMTTDGSNLSVTCTVKVPASGLAGDVDGDGNVSIADVTFLIDVILNGDYENIYFDLADLNYNGRLDIGDVTSLIDELLNGN